MIWPARKRLLGGLVHGVAQRRRALVGAVFQKPPRALHVVGDGRKRLVELVRQRRGHLAHGGQPRHVDQLGLQFLQPCFGLLPFGEVADEAGEEALIAHVHLADRKLHGKGRAVLALADDDAADADDAPLAGAQIAIEIAVVILAGRATASES